MDSLAVVCDLQLKKKLFRLANYPRMLRNFKLCMYVISYENHVRPLPYTPNAECFKIMRTQIMRVRRRHTHTCTTVPLYTKFNVNIIAL